jgi:hypothetical protein
MLAEIFVFERKASGYRLVGCPLYPDAPGLGQLLYTLGEDHACAGDGVIGDDDLPHRDSHPHPGLDAVVELCVVLELFGLECNSGGDGIGSTLEFTEQCIATQFAHVAMILADGGTEALKGGLDAFVCQLLVLLNQRGRACHIRMQDNGKPVASASSWHQGPRLELWSESIILY